MSSSAKATSTPPTSLVRFLAERSGYRDTRIPYKYLDVKAKQWKEGTFYTNKMSSLEVKEFAEELNKLKTPEERRLALSTRDSKSGHNAFSYVLLIFDFSDTTKNGLAINRNHERIEIKSPLPLDKFDEAIYKHFADQKMIQTIQELRADLAKTTIKQDLIKIMMTAFTGEEKKFVNDVLLNRNQYGEDLLADAFRFHDGRGRTAHNPIIPILTLIQHLDDETKKKITVAMSFSLLMNCYQDLIEYIKSVVGQDIFRQALLMNSGSKVPPFYSMIYEGESPILAEVKFVCDELKAWQAEWCRSEAKHKGLSPVATVFSKINETNIFHAIAARPKGNHSDEEALILECLFDLFKVLGDQEEFLKLMIYQGRCEKTPLHMAVAREHVKQVEVFAKRISPYSKYQVYSMRSKEVVWDRDEEVHDSSFNLLHTAVKQNNIPIVKIILESLSFAPESKRYLIEAKTHKEQTVFHFALRYGSREMIETIAKGLGAEGLRKARKLDKTENKNLSYIRENKHFKKAEKDSESGEEFYEKLLKRRLALSDAYFYLKERAAERNGNTSRRQDLKNRLEDFKQCFEAARKKEPFPSPQAQFEEKSRYLQYRNNFKLADAEELYDDALFVMKELKAHPDCKVTKKLLEKELKDKAVLQEKAVVQRPPSPDLAASLGAFIRASAGRSKGDGNNNDVELLGHGAVAVRVAGPKHA